MGTFFALDRAFVRRALVSVAVCFGALALGGVAQASINTETPISFLFTNPCTFESFIGSGMYHTSVDGIPLPGQNFHSQSNFQGVQGTTATGVKYVVPDQASGHINDAPPGTTVNDEFMQQFIRQGDDGTYVLGDDFYVKFQFVYVVNANGTTTVQSFSFTPMCQ
jgi:hypothetical protein